MSDAQPSALEPGGALDRALRLGLPVLLLALAAVALHSRGADVQVFRAAAIRFWQGAPLYPPEDGFYSFRYAPGVAVLFSALAPLSPPAARLAWMLVIVGAVLAIRALLARRFGARAWWAAPVAILALASPLVFELQYGQVNVVLLAMVVLAFALEDAGHPAWAGALLAFPVAAKVAPLVLGLEWLARRRWRALAGMALGGAAVLLLPALTYGLGGDVAQHLAWIRLDADWSHDVNALSHNQSVWALVARLGGGRVPGALAAAAVAAVALGARDLDLRRGLLLLAVPLVSPCGWIQNFFWAAPLVAVLLTRARPVAMGGALLAASTAILTHEVIGRAWTGWAFEHRLLALEMLALLVFARLAGDVPPGAPAPQVRPPLASGAGA